MPSTLTRRQIVTALLALVPALALGLPRFASAQSTPEPGAAAPEVAEMSLGDADAPVTIIEYAMFSCPHCADFNSDVFPKVKSEYIDTGKVRWVFREVYFNKQGLWAAMIARCAPQDRYFGIADLIFSTQSQWLMAADEKTLLEALYRIGRQAGLTDAQMNTCLQDRAFAEALVADYQKNAAADGIEATPTFIINGEKVDNQPWEDFKAKIDAALGA
jgi:protein-disulfide isomerase